MIPDEAGILRQVQLDRIQEGIEVIDHHDRAAGAAAQRGAVEVLLGVADPEHVLHRRAVQHRQQVVIADLLPPLTLAEGGNHSLQAGRWVEGAGGDIGRGQGR